MSATAPVPNTTPGGSELFDPAFLRSLEGLRILARRVPAGGRMAEQKSKARGGGVEFTDVRPYVAGDDFRAIDWHLLQRHDKVFLRLFLEEEDLPVHVVLDESASMAVEPPAGTSATTKATAARRVVAALAYIAAHHLDRVAVHPFADGPRAPLTGISGRAAFHRLLAWLARRPDAGSDTGLVATLRALSGRRLRRGLCVVVSDFLDPAGADAIETALKSLRHDLMLIRIAHPGEERPPLSGELELVDSETGASLAIHVDQDLLDRYAAAHAAFTARLDAVARSRRGSFLTVRTDAPIVPQLAALFPGGAHELRST